MPRDGANIYTQPFPDVAPSTTVASAVYNGFTHDVAQDLNTPRPIVAGGTAANNVDTALFNLNAEKAAQVVTNYDAHLFIPGSFYSATTATGSPLAGHAFSGVAYIGEALANPPTNQNVTLEARDTTDGKLYIRRKIAGVWGSWTLDGDLSGVTGAIALKVDKAGDTMTGMLVLPATTPTLGTHATSKTYVDAADTALAAADTALAATNTAQDTAINNRVRHDAAQGLSAAQQLQARQNIYAAPLDAMAYNGLQINGSMDVSQNFDNSVATAVSANSTQYYADMWRIGFFRSATLAISGQRLFSGSSPVSLAAPPGFANSISVRATTGLTTLATGDLVHLEHPVEAIRMRALAFGVASASSLTVGFWVWSTISGTCTVSLRNAPAPAARSCPVNVSIPNAGQWNYVTVTFPGDVTGTWLNSTATGLYINICCGAGATWQGTNGAWQAGNFFATSSTTNFMATTGNVFAVTGFGAWPGNEAPQSARSAFIMRLYPDELMMCKRYMQFFVNGSDFIQLYGYNTAGATPTVSFARDVEMRVAPTNSITGTWTVSNCSQPGASGVGVKFWGLFTTVTALGAFVVSNGNTGNSVQHDARLL